MGEADQVQGNAGQYKQIPSRSWVADLAGAPNPDHIWAARLSCVAHEEKTGLKAQNTIREMLVT